MFKKLLLAAAVCASCAASFAADIVTLDLNYWCRGNLKLLSKLPDGVTMTGRRNYSQKKFAHICLYTVKIDLDKVQEIELELEVVDTGDKESAKLNPSLCPARGKVFECVEFETADEPAKAVPCKITKWVGIQSVEVTKGEKITIKAKFKKAAKTK